MLAAIVTGLILILAGQKPLGKGLILGTLFSVVNFILMGEFIPLQLGRTRPKTYLISFGSIAIRYGLMAVPLLVALKFDQFSLWTVICGVFMIQIVIMVDHIRKRLTSGPAD